MAAEPPFVHWRERVEATLSRAIEAGACEPRLRAAMRHAALGGGKRLRALLAYAAGEACGADDAALDAAACAVECVHAFSLVHDDLLDVEGDDAQLGKTAGKDVAQGKATYVALSGAPAARDRLAALAGHMETALTPLGARADSLRALARFAIARSH